jgi:ankyrin repeat protein
VRVLIEHGANVRGRSDAGFAPLLFAAREADPNTTRILLAAGANVNDAASDGTTALLVATIRGHTAYAEFLLEQGADPNLGAGYTPLHWAAGDWDTDLTGRLAEGTEWSALGGLRGQTKLDFVKTLLAHGADPNARVARNPRRYGGGGGMAGNLAGGTPFLLAAMAGDVDVMRVLLAAGADPMLATTTNTTPLMTAAGLGYVPGATRIPERSALEAVTLCVELGADVNAVNAAGDTPLHGAAYRGADRIVHLLVDKGAKVNVKNKRQWTPLTVAEGINQSGGLERFPSTAALLRTLGAEPTPPDIQR